MKKLYLAEEPVRTCETALAKGGGLIGYVRIEHLVNGLAEELHELRDEGTHIVDWHLTEAEGGVEGITTSMLNEEESRRDRYLRIGLAHQGGIKEGLQIIVAVVGHILRLEDGFNVWKRTWLVAARLIVDDSNALHAVLHDAVKTVNTSADADVRGCAIYVAFQADDAERSLSLVDSEQLTEVMDDDLAADKL